MSGKDISFDLSSDYGQSNFSVAWICIYFAGEKKFINILGSFIHFIHAL